MFPARYKHRVFWYATRPALAVDGGRQPLPSPLLPTHIPVMAKSPDNPKKPGKTPKSKAHRPDVQPIGPALAELLNPAINRGESGLGSGTGLQPPRQGALFSLAMSSIILP
jgi:hypothetical protein